MPGIVVLPRVPFHQSVAKRPWLDVIMWKAAYSNTMGPAAPFLFVFPEEQNKIALPEASVHETIFDPLHSLL